MNTELKLDVLDRKEGLRYLGYGDNEPDEPIKSLLEQCEKEVLENAVPRYVYRVFEIVKKNEGIEIVGTNLILPGESITEHLKDCEKAALIGVTISNNIDKMLKIAQINDMAKAVILDSCASVAVEQACAKVEEIIKSDNPDYNQTWRFGLGYGDLPLSIQGDFLKVINAPKIIGLNANSSSMLIPTKSVTAIIGLTKGTVSVQKRGCQTCNMKDKCRFREKGGHCNV